MAARWPSWTIGHSMGVGRRSDGLPTGQLSDGRLTAARLQFDGCPSTPISYTEFISTAITTALSGPSIDSKPQSGKATSLRKDCGQMAVRRPSDGRPMTVGRPSDGRPTIVRWSSNGRLTAFRHLSQTLTALRQPSLIQQPSDGGPTAARVSYTELISAETTLI